MKVDETSHDDELTCIAGDFKQNYLFLSRLIDCKDKNNLVARRLEPLGGKELALLRSKLNRRQIKIFKEFLERLNCDEAEAVMPPVPPELEAAIRVRKRSTWLPWEAEAIRKIERWRGDIVSISSCWAESGSSRSVSLKTAGESFG